MPSLDQLRSNSSLRPRVRSFDHRLWFVIIYAGILEYFALYGYVCSDPRSHKHQRRKEMRDTWLAGQDFEEDTQAWRDYVLYNMPNSEEGKRIIEYIVSGGE